MTPDGKYIGGLSGTAKGFLYDVENNSVVQPSAGSPATKAVSGICYRLDTNQVPPQVQLILDSESVGWRAYFMTTNGGTNWLRTLMNSSYAYNTYGGTPGNNSLAGTTNGDVFVSTFRNSGKTVVYALWNSNLWTSATPPGFLGIGKSVSSPSTVDATGVAASGRIVGRRTDGDGISRNNLWDWPASSGTSYQPVVLDGTTAGQIWSISLDGNSIFGWSHTTNDAVNNFVYKAVLSGSSVSAQPPGSGITMVSVDPLPELALTGGSTTRGVPFGCTEDGKYAVGYQYTHATLAVLWDTSDPDPANWKAIDLSQLAATYNLGVPDVFSSLNRGYAVATNVAGDIVITGYGVEAGTGNNRAFIMTVPKSIAAAGFPQNPVLKFSGSYPGGLTLSYYLEPGLLSHLEYTTSLTSPSWTEIHSELVTTGATIAVPDANPTDQQRFYRVRLE